MRDVDPLDAASLPAVQTCTPARLLADGGLTVDEIAAALSMTAAVVRRQLAADGLPFVSPAHVLRVEDAMLSRAVGVTYSEELVTRSGEVLAVSRTLPPDPVAGKLMLTAHAPERYGEAAVPARDVGSVAKLELLAGNIVALLQRKREGVTVDGEAEAVPTPGGADPDEAAGGGKTPPRRPGA